MTQTANKARWRWLTQPAAPYRWGFVLRVIVKAALLFALVNVAFALLRPVEEMGRLSLYNVLVPGRDRLPYGENPQQSYSLSLNTLTALFASHTLARPKAADEYRVIVLGDSATWGWRLENADTLTGALNAAGLRTADGRRVVAYNLGYPIMSALKDLLLLESAMQYAPDHIVWLLTLDALPRQEQLFPPLVQHNAPAVRRLIGAYGLDLDPADPRLVEVDFWGATLVGQRRALADLLRLQGYALAWAGTGIDQAIPADYPPLANDFSEDLLTWQAFPAPQPLGEDALAFDVLRAGFQRAGDVPLLLVNEPIFIADGQNSAVRYNALYPRWAYDAYRQALAAQGWPLLEAWDLLPPEAFTDSPVHLTPAATRTLAAEIARALAGVFPKNF